MDWKIRKVYVRLEGKNKIMSFDLVFILPDISGPTGVRDHYTVPIRGADQQVFVIIIPYRLGGLFICIR